MSAALVLGAGGYWFNQVHYSARSPSLRVTIAAGCPASLGNAADVRNPGYGSFGTFVGVGSLGPRGATDGLICRYAGLPQRTLRKQLRLSAGQAAGVSEAAHVQHIGRTAHSISPPAGEPGEVILMVLGYPHRGDLDIWYSRTGHQAADNGFVQSNFYGPGTLPDDFAALVQAYARPGV
jgi:hypothetical protein